MLCAGIQPGTYHSAPQVVLRQAGFNLDCTVGSGGWGGRQRRSGKAAGAKSPEAGGSKGWDYSRGSGRRRKYLGASTWVPIEALGERRRVSIYQSHYLHVSILLGQHSGCGPTVVSRVHFDSL